ncbi:MAG: DNA double-strand break repair nuclease NurA [Firmicutes bacterium]|nr:DNA double-strand break repair nuclease NurA [Bacillota bacterium]
MLNWSKVARQIDELAASQVSGLADWKRRLGQALVDLESAEVNLARLVDKVRQSQTSWLVAEPVESLVRAYLPLPRPPQVTVAATDGSQIAPDHHEVVLCYLLNIGRVMLHYGTGEPPVLESVPYLGYLEDDLYQETNGRKVLVQGDLLAIRRTLFEWEHLVELSRRAKERDLPTVALIDGTLIQWVLEGKAEGVQQYFLQRYLALFEQMHTLEVPPVGYLSGTRSTDVVNLLRVYRCPQAVADCDHCAFRRSLELAPCGELEGLTDAALFKHRMLPGQRTGLFFSQSKVLQQYGRHRVAFFYVHVGHEIARVELPAWAALNPDLVELVHTVIVDQTQKGQGYPVALAEAHEQAVIKGADRETFYHLLTEALVRRGVTAAVSRKSWRKRSGLI